MWPFASRQDVHSEVDALRNELSQTLQSIQSVLTTEIRQRPPAPLVTPEITQLFKQIFDLQTQVKELVQVIHQLSATTSSGTSKPIHAAIQARINLALAAIHSLGNEHANWLEQHQVFHSEVQAVIADLQQKHQTSTHHVFPPSEEKQANTEPITPV